MITLKELSHRWRMDRKTIRRILEQAGVPCYTFNVKRNGSVRFPRAAVERFLEQATRRIKVDAD